MKTKIKLRSHISRAQREIWKAKEAMYNEVKNLPTREALKKMLQQSEQTTKKFQSMK